MKRLAYFGLILIGLILSSALWAHHGWSEYDSKSPLELTGVIQVSGYEHPHGFVQLRASGKEWRVILAPPSRMEKRGLSATMLAPGNTVSVYGYPHRSEANELRAERIIIDGKTTELR